MSDLREVGRRGPSFPCTDRSEAAFNVFNLLIY